MFENFNGRQKELIYRGLKLLMECNTGADFHNSDQGHPFYRGGGQLDFSGKDTAETNDLYKMLSELSVDEDLSEEKMVWYEDLSTWGKFCTFAVKNYDNPKWIKNED